MRVAIANVTDRLVGGVEAYLELVVEEFQRRGFELAFFHERGRQYQRPQIGGLSRSTRLSVEELGAEKALQGLSRWAPDVVFANAFTEPELERRVLEVAPAFFFAHAYYGTCISGSKTRQLPVVAPCERRLGAACLLLYLPARCGGQSPVTMVTEYRRQKRRLRNLNEYRAIFTFSEHMRREFVKHGFSPARVVQVPPVYPSFQARTSQTSVLVQPVAAAQRALRLCFVGRIELLKGLHLLMDALPLVRQRVGTPVVLTVAGDGPELNRCRAMADAVNARDSSIAVDFLGWLPRENCHQVIASHDVLVVPSVWPEPFGLAGAEAVRTGIPVAAFRVGAIPEWLVDGRDGALADANPPTAAGIATAIERAARLDRTSMPVAHPSDRNVDAHVDALLAAFESARRADGPARRSR